MKCRIILLCTILSLLAGCGEKPEQPEYPSNGGVDETEIVGQLHFAVNPFDTSDSVLCLHNIQTLVIATHDSNYLNYLDEVTHAKRYNDPLPPKYHELHGDYHAGYRDFPESSLFYVVKDGAFVSLMNDTKTCLIDSLTFVYTIKFGTNTKERNCVLYTSLRPLDYKGSQHDGKFHIFLEDYVAYGGRDFDDDCPLVFDKISPVGDTILCINGDNGPSYREVIL